MSVVGRFVYGTVMIFLLAAPEPILAMESAASAPSSKSAALSREVSGLQIAPISSGSFDTVFSNICNYAHVLVISEGIPFHAELSQEQLVDLARLRQNDDKESIAATIVKLANAYDYDVEQTDATTFLLRKRYSDPKDLPCVTYSEISHALESILQIVDAYSPVDSPGEVLSEEDLYNSLTPEQQKQAVTGLQLSDLNAGQRSLALLALEHSVLEPRIESIRRATNLLSLLKRKDTVFGWIPARRLDQSQTTAFGYRGKFGTNGEVIGRPLTAPFKSAGDGPYTWITIQPPASTRRSSVQPQAEKLDGQNAFAAPISNNPPMFRADKGVFQASNEVFEYDPTAPSDEDRLTAPLGMLAYRLPRTMTLQEAASRVVNMAPDGTSYSRHEVSQRIYVSVDNAIADKPVNVFGFENAKSTRDYLSALSRLYGVQLLVGKNQHYNIVLPRPRSTETPKDVPTEIARITPLPLIDELAGQTARISKEMLNKQEMQMSSSTISDAYGTAQTSRDQRQIEREAAVKSSDALYFPAVRRLLALAEPSVPSTASPPVSVSALAPESERLIALTILSGKCMAEVRYLQKYVPPECIVNPDKLWITMTSVSTGAAPLITASFGRRFADGTFKYDAITRSMTLRAGVSSAPNLKSP